MKILALAALLSAAAHAGHISMTNEGSLTERNTPAWGYTTCYYKQSYGAWGGNPMRVSIVVESSWCPMTIKYDPVAGTWTR